MGNDASEVKKTPLYDFHKIAGAKMVPFGGWLMPVSYAGVLAEHKAVREQCGLFDVSHMGEVFVRGDKAEEFLQSITINNIKKLGDGNGQYSAILNHDGGMIDDLIIYRLKAGEYLICVNASNADKDFAWIKEQSKKFPNAGNLRVENESSQWSQLAVQGPKSCDALAALCSPMDKTRLLALEYTHIMPLVLFGLPSYVARTGYTGEHGYEIYVPNAIAGKCWQALLETTIRTGLQPIGLGARDTLRLEACYLLYGNDMNEDVTPLEAGISWAVKLDCGDFIGRDRLIKQKEAGLTRRNMAFVMEEGIPRHDMNVYLGDELVGKVTSGSVLPTIGGAGGMGLFDPRKVDVGSQVEVDVRGKRKAAKIVKKPLYAARVKG